MPSRPETRKTAIARRAEGECRTRTVTTATMTIPVTQSIAGWRGGMTKRRSRQIGIERTTPVALPRAAMRTASSPLPSRHSEWAGRTATAVSASGTPRNVLGTASRKQCATSAETKTAAMKTGPKSGRRNGRNATRMLARVLTWMPGRRPDRVPRATPAAVPANISIIPARGGGQLS